MGRVVGDLAEPDAARSGTAVGHLDRADHEDFALMAAPAAALTGSFLLRQTSSVLSTSIRPDSRLRPGATMLRRSLAHVTKPICRSRGRADVAVAAPRCRWNGWPSGRRPGTRWSAAAE